MLIHSNHAASSIYNHCRRFAPFSITSVGLTQKGVAISTPFCLLRISIAAFIESRNSAASCNLPLSKICPPPSTTLCCRNISLHGAFQSRECLLCNSLFFFSLVCFNSSIMSTRSEMMVVFNDYMKVD